MFFSAGGKEKIFKFFSSQPLWKTAKKNFFSLAFWFKGGRGFLWCGKSPTQGSGSFLKKFNFPPNSSPQKGGGGAGFFSKNVGIFLLKGETQGDNVSPNFSFFLSKKKKEGGKNRENFFSVPRIIYSKTSPLFPQNFFPLWGPFFFQSGIFFFFFSTGKTRLGFFFHILIWEKAPSLGVILPTQRVFWASGKGKSNKN